MDTSEGAAAAADPNTDDAALAALAVRFPAEVLANPYVTIYAMSGALPPSFGEEVQRRLASEPAIPHQLRVAFEAHAEHSDAWLHALLANPTWAVPDRHVNRVLTFIRDARALAGFVRERRGVLPQDPMVRRRFGIGLAILDPEAPPEALRQHVAGLTAEVPIARAGFIMRAFAARDTLPASVGEALLKAWVARRTAVLSDLKSRNRWRKEGAEATAAGCLLLAHPSFADRLEEWVTSPPFDPVVRDWAVVALRQRVQVPSDAPGPAVLLALADHPSPVERRFAARFAVGAEAVARAAADPDPRVRAIAAAHADVDEATRARLAADPEPHVALAALGSDRRLAVANVAAQHPCAGVRVAAARAAPTEGISAALASDPHPSVRGMVAEWTEAREVLRTLAADPHPGVRQRILENQKAPWDLRPRDRAVQAASRHELDGGLQRRQLEGIWRRR
jgi:hypothetical protein